MMSVVSDPHTYIIGSTDTALQIQCNMTFSQAARHRIWHSMSYVLRFRPHPEFRMLAERCCRPLGVP